MLKISITGTYISSQVISQDVFLKNANGSQPIHTLAMQVQKRIICCLSYTIYTYMYKDGFHHHVLISRREIGHCVLARLDLLRS